MTNSIQAHSSELSEQWSLAEALSRVSSILGIYIPAHQFSEQNIDDSDNFSDTIESLWKENHPSGSTHRIENIQNISQSELLVGILINKSNRNIYVLRGLQGPDKLVLESKNLGQTILDIINIENEYELITLNVDPELNESLVRKTPVTATEWFLHLILKKNLTIKYGIFATIMMNLLALGTAMYSMQVYDRVVPSQSNSTLIVLTIGVLIAIIFEFLIKQLRSKVIDFSFKDVDLELSSIFFNRALGIRLDVRPKNVGTFISELRQFETVRGFMTSSTLFVFADAPFAIFFAFFMMLIGGLLGVIPLVFLVVMLITGLYLSKQLNESNKQLIEENNQKSGFMIEAMDGIESIKAAAAEPYLLHIWQKINMRQSVRELHHRHVSSTSGYMAASVQQVAYILTVAAGALMIHNNQLTMGGLIGCTILSGRVLGPLAQIPQLLVQWSQTKISLKSLNNIMSLPCDTDNHGSVTVPDKLQTQLQLEDVSFGYDPKHNLITVKNLQFKAGELTVILGRVGSGKSTLLKLISGLYRPSQGQIRIGNIDMSQLPSGLIRNKIGYLPQDTRLIRGTLKENITLGLPYSSDTAVIEAAQKVGLDRLINSHPLGLSLPISEGGLGLSGGQKQMVVLARILLASPDILLLDEPTASLDGELENHVIKSLLTNMNANKLMLVVTHKPSMIRFATRVIVVDNGKIVEDGPRDDVLNRLKEKSTQVTTTHQARAAS